MITFLNDTIKSRLSSGFHLSSPSMEWIQSNLKTPCPSRPIWGAVWYGVPVPPIRWDSERPAITQTGNEFRAGLIESHEWDKPDCWTGLFILAPSVQTPHLDVRVGVYSVVWVGNAKTKSLCRVITIETWATRAERPVLAALYCTIRHSSVALTLVFYSFLLNWIPLAWISLGLWGLIINYGEAVVSLSPAVENWASDEVFKWRLSETHINNL